MAALLIGLVYMGRHQAVGQAGQGKLACGATAPFSQVCLGKPVNNPDPAVAKCLTKIPAGRGGESEFKVSKGSCREVLDSLQRAFLDPALLDPPGTVYRRLIRVAC